MPAELPAAFWNTEYYASMADVMEACDQESDLPAVRARSELDTAQTQLMRARSPAVAAERSLHSADGAAEVNAPQDVEPEPAGVIYGMEAIMAGTADFEEPTTLPQDDAQVSFVGSLTLLLHAEAVARVHYEGKLVYGDPSPRELVSKGSSASPGNDPCRPLKLTSRTQPATFS